LCPPCSDVLKIRLAIYCRKPGKIQLLKLIRTGIGLTLNVLNDFLQLFFSKIQIRSILI